jgi:hypothetical protein
LDYRLQAFPSYHHQHQSQSNISAPAFAVHPLSRNFDPVFESYRATLRDAGESRPVLGMDDGMGASSASAQSAAQYPPLPNEPMTQSFDLHAESEWGWSASGGKPDNNQNQNQGVGSSSQSDNRLMSLGQSHYMQESPQHSPDDQVLLAAASGPSYLQYEQEQHLRQGNQGHQGWGG